MDARQSASVGSLAALDAEELFVLGVRASVAGDSATALNLFKQACERDARHAEAAWMLGAEYAQLGMIDRAKLAMQHALSVNETLQTARFQLGLLHLTSGEVALAEAIWLALGELDEGHPLRLFKEGMLQLAADDFRGALASLRRGAEVPNVDAALKRDMEMMIQQIETQHPESAVAHADSAVQIPAGDPGTEDTSFFLEAYLRGNSGGSKH